MQSQMTDDRIINGTTYRIIRDGRLYRIREGLGQLLMTPSGRRRYWRTWGAAMEFLDELERMSRSH